MQRQQLITRSNVTSSNANDPNPDFLYLALAITNQLSEGGSAPVEAIISKSFDQPIISDLSLYHCSVVRWFADTGPTNLPVFSPTIQLNTTDPNLTVYSMTFNYTDPSGVTLYSQQYIEYVPQISTSILPAPPKVSGQQANNSNSYYNVYSYEIFVAYLNTISEACYQDLSAQLIAVGQTMPSNYWPEFSWNSEQEVVNIYVPFDNSAYDDTQTNYIGIYFNQALFSLMSSFAFNVDSYGTSVGGRNMRVLTVSANGSSSSVIQYPFYAPVRNTLQITQDSSTIAQMNPVMGMAIGTTLPIVATQFTPPVLWNSGVAFTQGSQNLSLPLISDFQSDSGNYKDGNFILYSPTAEYRWITLNGSGPLREIQQSLVYLDRLNNTYAVRLGSGCSFNTLTLFQKKSLVP
jgi:hypothetical protein